MTDADRNKIAQCYAVLSELYVGIAREHARLSGLLPRGAPLHLKHESQASELAENYRELEELARS